jgi:argininosuccinate synthase
MPLSANIIVERIVLAYSDADAVAIPWLQARHGAGIIALTVDLGQGEGLESVRDCALAVGALRAHVVDAREEFIRDYVLPALRANALHDGERSMVRALAQALIARKIVEAARLEEATAVALGSVASDDRARLEAAIRALDPSIRILTSPSDRETDSTEALEAFPSVTRGFGAGPDEPAHIEIAFERGTPIAINGVSMSFPDLIGSLGIIAGASSIALVLHEAHRDLQEAVVASEIDGFAGIVSRQYVDLIARGRWSTSLRPALDAFVDCIQERVTGMVRLRLFKGNCRIVDRQSPFAASDSVLKNEAAACGVLP